MKTLFLEVSMLSLELASLVVPLAKTLAVGAVCLYVLVYKILG